MLFATASVIASSSQELTSEHDAMIEQNDDEVSEDDPSSDASNSSTSNSETSCDERQCSGWHVVAPTALSSLTAEVEAAKVLAAPSAFLAPRAVFIQVFILPVLAR